MKVLWISSLTVFFAFACATGGKKDKGSSGAEGAPSNSAKSERKSAPDDRKEISVTGTVKPFVNSLSNSPQSSKTVDQGKAKSLASRLENQLRQAKGPKVDPMDVLAVMSAKRLGGENSREVISSAKRLVGQEMRQDINKKLPEIGQLEIATSAFQSKQYGMAEYYIIQLLDSKSPPIKSAALNLNGLMKYKFSTVRNATDIWEAALKVDSSNQAARLNLALVALMHADHKTASRLLEASEQDWFTQGSLAVAEKLALKGKRAQELCANALKKQARNRILLFNCAVADFQVAGDYDAALDKLQKANSMSGGSSSLSDKIIKGIKVVKAKKAEAGAAKKPEDKKK